MLRQETFTTRQPREQSEHYGNCIQISNLAHNSQLITYQIILGRILLWASGIPTLTHRTITITLLHALRVKNFECYL